MSIQGKPASQPPTALDAFRDGAPLKDVEKAAKEAAEQPHTSPLNPLDAGQTTAQDDDAAYSAQSEIAKRAMNSRVSKTTRISQYHNLCLREYSNQQTKQQGRNVSEADVLEEALTEFFKKRKFVLK